MGHVGIKELASLKVKIALQDTEQVTQGVQEEKTVNAVKVSCCRK